MKQVQFGTVNHAVSAVILGCMRINSAKDPAKAIETAYDNGINFFDTADTYGLGTSEKTLAKALGSRKNDVVIADKFGVRVENGHTFYDNSPEWIEKALAGSLQRLGRDYIDLYQIHYRDNVTPIESVVEALEGLKEKGYIRYLSLIHI